MSVGATTSILDGIGSLAFSSGSAGNVAITATALTLTHDGLVSSLRAPGATGGGGNVAVNISGMLSIDGSGGIAGFRTGILGDTFSSPRGGSVAVNASGITITGGSCAAGGGNCSGVISSNAEPGASGDGGTVAVNAGSISIAGSGGISTNTFGSGNGGDVSVNAAQIALANGGEIVSTTAGTGSGGSVTVTTPGVLTLDGMGNMNTQIAAWQPGRIPGPVAR
jgi:hypothetical protein